MNRVRDITNSDLKSKELIKYLNLLYDMSDVKVFYTELGGKDIDVANALENLEEGIIEQHSEFLKKEMPAMLRDPMYKPYTERLLNEYKSIGLVDETEAKIFEGELRLQRFEEELKEQKKKKVRNLGGMTKIGLGFDKNLIASRMGDYNQANMRDSIDMLMIFKSDPDRLMQNNTEKDSMTLIESRRMLQIELQKLKARMASDDERQFLIKRFGDDLDLNLDQLTIRPLEGGGTAQATKTAGKAGDAPGTGEKTEDGPAKAKLSLAERRALRLAEKKEKAALEQEKKDEPKDKKDVKKDDKKKDEKKDDKKKDEKKDDKKDAKKDDKKKDDKKKDEKKDEKKKDDKKKDDKKKDDKKASASKDKKKK